MEVVGGMPRLFSLKKVFRILEGGVEEIKTRFKGRFGAGQ